MKYIFVLLAIAFPLTGICNDHEEHAAPAAHTTAPASAKHTPHWSYGGENGPEHWGTLDSEFAKCDSGKEQSPIDLLWSKQKGSRKLEFFYQAAPFGIIDNGHTIQVNIAPGSYAIIDGHRYNLVQFHFHAVSEHTFTGKHFPLEAHFVHKDEQGKLAVIGVMFEEGKKNASLEKIFSHFPSKTGEEQKISSTFDPSSLFPKSFTHYQYSGSLTTPPCSEGVNWTVLNTPVQFSEEQLKQFNHLYITNNRPVQPLHERHPASFR